MEGPAAVRVRASAVCRRGDAILTVRAIDPVDGRQYLFLPGGAIEPGETPATAAERETLEETGYAVTIDPTVVAVERSYTFIWAGLPVACHTTFCRARLVDPTAAARGVRDADYLSDVEWVDLSRLDAAFDYHDTIRDAVRAMLANCA
jgi:tRNA(adenine34) deaminase